MSPKKVPRNLSLSVAGLLSLCVCVTALGQPGGKEIARQMAAAADDDAAGLEARQDVLKKLKEVVYLLLGAGETVEAAGVLNRIGRLQLKLSLPQASLDSHQQALSLLKRTPDAKLEVDSLNGLGEAYLLVKEKNRAEQVLNQSSLLSKQSGYTRGQAEALLTLGDLQNYENHAQGLKTAQRALELWQTLGDKNGLAHAYSLVARCYMAQSILPEANHNYEEALKIWQESNNLSEQAEALIMLGFIEYRKGEWQSAITFLTQAQGLLDEKAEPYRMGQIAAGLGAAFNENGLPEFGITHYQRALSYYRQTQDPHLIMIANWGLGRTYYLLESYPKALTHFQQALVGLAENGLDAAQNYEYIGRVYGAMGEYAKARAYLQSSLVIYTRANNPREAAEVRGLLGQFHEQQGQLQPAERYYRRSLQTFVRLSDRLNQAAVYYVLGRLELKRSNNEVAETYLRQSIEITENIRRVPISSDLTAAFSATVHERYESYIECLMRKHQRDPMKGFDVHAFNTSELARGRALAELLRATQTNLAPGLDPQLAQREKSIRQSLRVREDYRVTLLSKEYKREELAALDMEIAKLETEYKEVNETIQTKYASYGQITRPNGWDLRQIQEQVIADNQTVLLEYSLGAEKSYVWAVTNTQMTSYELPAQAQITEAAQRVYQLLKDKPATGDTNELTNAVQLLGSMVLSPVAAELNKHRIIVVADGALNYIPFQILPSADNDPLVISHEVVNAPSASILGQLQQEAARRQTPVNVLAAFGDPVFASNYAQQKETDNGKQVLLAQTNENKQWQHAVRDIEPSGDSFNPSALEPLFFTKRELANLRDVGGSETFVATGFDASREKLESADLTKYAILHFATHGILDPKRPENSGIFLSMVDRGGQPQNGFVGLQDIYGLRAPVNLVVLSACRTGLGKEVRGEGLIGLTRGFMYAGASSVMASLWKVDDEATAELMRRFYTNMLQRGMTPAAALGAAQNSIRQEPQWRAPYYWAAFTMQGEYRQVIRPAPSKAHPRYIWIFVVALLLSLAGLGWQYRRLRRMRTA